jgi:hypothetical protein
MGKNNTADINKYVRIICMKFRHRTNKCISLKRIGSSNHINELIEKVMQVLLRSEHKLLFPFLKIFLFYMSIYRKSIEDRVLF